MNRAGTITNHASVASDKRELGTIPLGGLGVAGERMGDWERSEVWSEIGIGIAIGLDFGFAGIFALYLCPLCGFVSVPEI